MRERETLSEAWGQVRAWVDDVVADPHADELLARPSVLPGWSVADLVAHLALALSALAALEPAPRGTSLLSAGEYVRTYPDGAAAIDERTRALAEGASSTDLPATLDEAWRDATDALDRLGADGRRGVLARRGPIRLDDMVRTRVLELVVHGDDLSRSLPERTPVRPGRAATRVAVTLLLDAVAEKAPGRSVEVRVPPFAAVQCVEGTTHTRGVPPNVVETDPTTWIRLACGRTTWQAERDSGSVTASGSRADAVGTLLPLL